MSSGEGQGSIMATIQSRGRKIAGGLAFALLLGGAIVGWMERTPLLSWFYVRGLAHADLAGRERWVERVVGLGASAVPDLLGYLSDPNPAVCANVCAALKQLQQGWPAEDDRPVLLAGNLVRGWDTFSPAGKASALDLAAGWFTSYSEQPTPALVSANCRLVAEAARGTDADVQPRALDLCAAILPKPGGAEVVSPARGLIRACLASADSTVRVRAVRLALYPGMDLLEDVAVLLSDPSPEVRRAAVLAVGPADQVVRDEGLLESLHDPDAAVRSLCEAALRGRGLRPEHISLGRLLTDPRPTKRLEVLDQLRLAPDLDPGIWLRRLSHDPSPAVRAAAMRAMSQQSAVDLTDRIDQMARNDPSPTVCLLARYYLKAAKVANQ